MKNWYYSIILLISYLLTFHLWMHVNLQTIKLSGIIIAICLCLFTGWSNSKGYFPNTFDLFWHCTVILDILLEAWLIKDHDHYGFYGCATAFAVIIGGYHYKKLNDNRCSTPDPIESRETIASD